MHNLKCNRIHRKCIQTNTMEENEKIRRGLNGSKTRRDRELEDAIATQNREKPDRDKQRSEGGQKQRSAPHARPE